MKSKHMLSLAFVLNASFSLFELAGGLFTGSTAILSDAVHDLGDTFSIGVSYLLEKLSKRPADERYTLGYARYSVLGGVIAAVTLFLGSAVVIVHAFNRWRYPAALHYEGMIALAVVGCAVNGAAAFLTHRGETLNEKAIFWHLFEDVLGWLVVLIGAVVMRLTDWVWIDPLLSVGVALFTAIHAVGHIREGIGVFLEKSPVDIGTKELIARLKTVEGVLNVEKLYILSLNGVEHCAAVCLQTSEETELIKPKVRAILEECGIVISVIETAIAENVR